VAGDVGEGGTTSGLTHGVGSIHLPDDEATDQEINRERHQTTGGKASQRDSNIKTD
jgi:hypothetical protein